MKILLTGQDPLFRVGMRQVLSRARDVEILGEAADCPSAIEKIQSLKPEVALIDESIPGLAIPKTIRLLRTRVPELKMIVFSNFGFHDQAHQIFAEGADCCVIKSVNNRELIAIISAIYEDRAIETPFCIDASSVAGDRLRA